VNDEQVNGMGLLFRFNDVKTFQRQLWKGVNYSKRNNNVNIAIETRNSNINAQAMVRSLGPTD